MTYPVVHLKPIGQLNHRHLGKQLHTSSTFFKYWSSSFSSRKKVGIFGTVMTIGVAAFGTYYLSGKLLIETIVAILIIFASLKCSRMLHWHHLCIVCIQ